MPHGFAGLLMCITLLGSSLACAEQRFYQVVDPDGRVRIIKAPDEPEQGKEKTNPANNKKSDKTSGVVSSPDALPEPKASTESYAPYNGDDYLDSERLESSGFNPEQKRNFYIINDGLGSRVEQAPKASMNALEVKPPVQDLPEAGLPIPSEREEISDVAVMRSLLASNSLCVSRKSLEKASSLVRGRLYSLILDQKALRYQEPLGVVGAYKLSADGMRTLTLRSYARNERSPEFAVPLLAIADSAGCIQRIVTGYFQSRFEATKAKHSMLEGAVTIHADEPYLLIIASGYQGPAHTTYKRSQYGQLSIKWQP